MSERVHLESSNSLGSSSWPDDGDWLNGGDEDEDRSVIWPIIPPDIDYFDEDDFYPVEPVTMSPYEDEDDEDFDDNAEELTEAEIESIEEVCSLKNREEVIESWRVMQPFIDKIQPSMLKKVYDGWAKRRNMYRQRTKMGDGVIRTDDEDLDVVAADLFYLGTIFRDYLDSVLGLKNQERSGFQLFDSTDPEATESNSAIAWYNPSNYTVNCIGDRVETKEEFLGALAHEMWHARQLQVAEEGGIDSEAGRYRDDFSKLREQNRDERFQNRLEQEARVFEYFFSRLLRSAMLFAPEMYDELTEPIDLSPSSPESISEVLHEVVINNDEGVLAGNPRDPQP